MGEMRCDCRELIGVEIIPEAIEDAKENALRNGIANARFICGDASSVAAAALAAVKLKRSYGK